MTALTSDFQGFPHIPDYRLRAVVRTFLKSLINKCPHRYFQTVVAPLLHQLMPYMLRRLTEKWNQVFHSNLAFVIKSLKHIQIFSKFVVVVEQKIVTEYLKRLRKEV